MSDRDEKRLERIEDKVDKVTVKLSDIDGTLIAQHITLKEHMRRTELLEDAIKPVTRHVNMMQGALAFISTIALITGIIKLFK